MSPWQRFGMTLVIVGVLAGCRKELPVEKSYPLRMSKGVEQAKQLLQQYAQGLPMGSEVSWFPQIVEETKKTDADKAALLEQGFAELVQIKDASTRATRAKAILDAL